MMTVIEIYHRYLRSQMRLMEFLDLVSSPKFIHTELEILRMLRLRLHRMGIEVAADRLELAARKAFRDAATDDKD